MAGFATSAAAPATMTEAKPAAIKESSAGRVALVTGGATGLGRTIAMEFGRSRCKVAFCWYEMDGRDVEASALLTETTLSSMGIDVYAARCDVRDRSQVDRFVAEVQAALRRRASPHQQCRHRARRRALAADAGRLGCGAGHQRDRRVPLPRSVFAALSRAALGQGGQCVGASGDAARIRRFVVRRKQGGAGGSDARRRRRARSKST